jgi:hypothetical protein
MVLGKWLSAILESQEKGKNGSTERSKGNKPLPGKVATTRTEDGHK